MERFDEGLRCQDIHSGLRDVDPNSPALAPLMKTRLVGMAANVAGLIRGRDVIQDGDALRTVAAQQLDVNMYAFDQVIGLLEDVGFVDGVQRSGTRLAGFTESIPYYESLYETLGQAWEDFQPTEQESQMVVVVDGLSRTPVPMEELEARFGLDHAAVPGLLDLGKNAGLVRTVRTVDGDIAYSPFFGFENPAQIEQLATDFGTGQLVNDLAAVRQHQGLEIGPRYPVLSQAVAAGLIMAPSVRRPDGATSAYAALPYFADQRLLTVKKPVLEKALAVLACLRSASTYAEFNRLPATALVPAIDKLLDPNRGFLEPNSAHRRQYELMRNAGIIRFGPDTMPGGHWVTPTFIATEDNREALLLARELITHGDLMSQRVDDETARRALDTGGRFAAPIQTMNRLRPHIDIVSKDFGLLLEKAMGTGAM